MVVVLPLLPVSWTKFLHVFLENVLKVVPSLVVDKESPNMRFCFGSQN